MCIIASVIVFVSYFCLDACSPRCSSVTLHTSSTCCPSVRGASTWLAALHLSPPRIDIYMVRSFFACSAVVGRSLFAWLMSLFVLFLFLFLFSSCTQRRGVERTTKRRSRRWRSFCRALPTEKRCGRSPFESSNDRRGRGGLHHFTPLMFWEGIVEVHSL